MHFCIMLTLSNVDILLHEPGDRVLVIMKSLVCTSVSCVSGWLLMCVIGLTPATSLTYGH